MYVLWLLKVLHVQAETLQGIKLGRQRRSQVRVAVQRTGGKGGNRMRKEMQEEEEEDENEDEEEGAK